MTQHNRLTVVFIVIVLAFAGLVVVGCVGVAPPSVPGGAPAGSQPAALPLGIDPATYEIVTYQRTGGVAGQDARAQLFLDGHVALTRRGEDPVAFQLTTAEQSQIEAAFESADFYRNVQQAPTPGPVPADAFQYELMRRGALLQGTLRTHEAEVPAWAKSLLPLLDNLLLSPDPARIAAFQPGSSAETVISPTLETPVPAPAIVLVEFVRTGKAGEERLLINMDRTYSVARAGEVQAGQLTEEEMAALLKMMETADLRKHRGDYLPETVCDSCPGYELTYRNLFGAYKVRSQEGSLPDWMQVISSVLVDSFLAPEGLAARPTLPVAGVPVTTTAVISATAPAVAAAVPTAIQTPTPAPTATPLPVTTEQPTVAASPTVASTTIEVYGLADLIGDLVAAGARVAPAPGRIVKPYLSVNGVIVNVDGQPVQVFEYANEATLAHDVAGLAPDASSIDGTALTWPSPPRFWRRGAVLALALTEDAVLVERLNQALGAPFAGVQ
jgi:hypothetical protein